MLTTVLPGLRELRAPLSAGFLWLLAIWFVFESSVPDETEASGVVASVYRLESLLSVIGLGAAITFGAYLIGSLSVFVFSAALRRVMRTSLDQPGQWRDALSLGAWQALYQVAGDAQQKLEGILSLTGVDVDEAIRASRGGSLPGGMPRKSRLLARRKYILRDSPDESEFEVGHRNLRSRTRQLMTRLFPSSRADDMPTGPRGPLTHQDRSAGQQRALAALVVRDLDVIAAVRLLGKHPDVFSAVDRDRAEVDFRLAVIPGVVALTVSIAVHESVLVGALVCLVGFGVAAGLLLDALRQQRLANDLLLDLLQVGDITCPSLQRLESWAIDRADLSPAKQVARQARTTSSTVATAFDQVRQIPDSAPIGALTDAFPALVTAHEELAELARMISPITESPVIETGEHMLSLLDDVASIWLYQPDKEWQRPAAWGSELPPDVLETLSRAERERSDFVRQLGDVVLDVTTQEAARSAAEPA